MQPNLADGRGRLFDFKNSDALAETVKELLDDQDRVLHELKDNAYEYGLHLRWPVTGAEFIKVAQEAIPKV
jgi:glycosyltransferase involved in cell wall biosynthesis